MLVHWASKLGKRVARNLFVLHNSKSGGKIVKYSPFTIQLLLSVGYTCLTNTFFMYPHTNENVVSTFK